MITTLTFGFFLGRSNANFLAAASIEAAAASSSCSAITFGSFGSTQSEPEKCDCYLVTLQLRQSKR